LSRNKKNRLLLVSDSLSYPIDEGVKNISFNLLKELKCSEYNILAINPKSNQNISDNNIKGINSNKYLLNYRLFDTIRSFKPDVTLYIPIPGRLFGTLLKSFIIKLYSKSSIVVYQLQPFHDASIITKILAFLLRNKIGFFVASQNTKNFLLHLGFKASLLFPGVDVERFRPVDEETRSKLKIKYNLDPLKKYALHIGHLNKGRNLISLINDLKNSSFSLILVVSESILQDEKILSYINKYDIKIINSYVDDIQEIYQIVDLYIFYVNDTGSAIEIPLSVLEAMSTNLPVITTKFGGLMDMFPEKISDLVFLKEGDCLLDYLNNISSKQRLILTRNSVIKYSWKKCLQQVNLSI